MPYVKGLTEKIKNVFNKVNISIALKPTNTLSKHFFTKLKNTTEKDLRSNLIYQVNCNDCNDLYVGETCQYLKKRMYQHNNDSKKNYLEMKGALYNHLKEKSLNFILDNVIILGIESSVFKRKFKGSRKKIIY